MEKILRRNWLSLHKNHHHHRNLKNQNPQSLKKNLKLYSKKQRPITFQIFNHPRLIKTDYCNSCIIIINE